MELLVLILILVFGVALLALISGCHRLEGPPRER